MSLGYAQPRISDIKKVILVLAIRIKPPVNCRLPNKRLGKSDVAAKNTKGNPERTSAEKATGGEPGVNPAQWGLLK